MIHVPASPRAWSTPFRHRMPRRLASACAVALAAGLAAACAGGLRGAPAGPGAGGACRWPVASVVLRQAADTLYQSWTFEADRLPARIEGSRLPAVAAYLDTVRARVGSLDPRALLRRQVAYYAARPDSASRGEAVNGRMVLDGSAGTLRPASCLEALLVETQAARFPMASRPTEFHALILDRADDAGRRWVRVYQAGSSAPWPPKANLLLEHVAADRREGWRVVAHLHNHPFELASGGDIAGANAPSMTDVQFWRFLRDDYGIASARVTNGFATFEAPAASFARLRAPGDP